MNVARRLPPLLALLLLAAAAATGQQPFVTDDADVTPKGHFHFEFSNEFDLLQRSLYPTRLQNTADAELNYGLWDGVEIGIEAPVITLFNARGTDPRLPAGLGDTNLSLKYNFLEEQQGSRRPALAVAFNVELPTGSVPKGLGSGLTDFYTNAILQKSLSEQTTLRVNGGALFSGNEATGAVGIRTRGTVFTGGASVVRQFTPKLALGAEVTGAAARSLQLSKGQLQAQVGGNYALRENFTLDFGVLGGRYAASPRVGVQFGLSVDF